MTPFQQALHDSFQLNSIVCSSDQLKKCRQLFALTQKWGSKINLTANLSIEMFIQENLLDPILALIAFENSTAWQTLLNSLPQTDQKATFLNCIDIGCGGGFVGIAWSLFSKIPISITFLDRDRRKINFCRQVIRDLGLANAQSWLGSLDDFSLNNRQQFDACVSRATIGVEGYFQACKSLLKPSGIALYFASFSALQDTHLPHSSQLHYQIEPAKIQRSLSLTPASS